MTPTAFDVRIHFRALPFTPMAKLCLVNQAEALFSYYTLERRELLVGSERMQMFDPDPLGLVRLFGTDSSSDDTAFVEQAQVWCNSLWDSVTADLTLS